MFRLALAGRLAKMADSEQQEVANIVKGMHVKLRRELRKGKAYSYHAPVFFKM